MAVDLFVEAPSNSVGAPTYAYSAAVGPELPAPGTPAIARRSDVILVAIVGFAFFALNIDFQLSGDAAMYADFVLLRKFDELTLHIGYYAVLFVAHRALGAVFGIPIQEAAAWLNVFVGSLALAVVYLLGCHFLGRRGDGLLCVAVFALSGRVLNNATSSEIYMLQTLLVLTSFYLFVREWPTAAGLVAGMALLVSPLSAFAYLFFPVLEYQRAGRIRLGVALRLVAAGALVYLPYLAIFWRELLYGTRGLLIIHDEVPFDPQETLHAFIKYQFKAYTLLLLLLVPAAFAARRHWRFLLLSLAVAVPHLYIILKLTGEDHVFILNTDFFFACWLVIGWRELARFAVGRWVAPLPLASHAALLLAAGTIFRFQSHRAFGQEMRTIAQTYLVGRDAVMITDWTTAVDLTFYGRQKPTTVVADEPLHKQMYDIDNPRFMDPRILEAREMYLVESWEPQPLNVFLRPKAWLRTQREQNAILSRAQRMLDLRCEPVEDSTRRVYRCTRRAPVA